MYRYFYHISQPAAEELDIESGEPEQRILISIETVGAKHLGPPRLDSGRWRDILRLSFHDTDGPGSSHRGFQLTPDQELKLKHFTLDDATAIIEFVRKHESADVESVYVHCAAGISRSAGVAKALMETYGASAANQDLVRYDNYNRFVYRTLIEECYERQVGSLFNRLKGRY